MITYTGKDEILNSLRVIPPCSMVVETSCGNSRKVLGRYWEVYKRILKGEKVSKWEIFWNILTSFFKPMPGPELRGHACIYWGGGKNEVVEAALGKVSWFLFSLPHGIIQRSDFKGKIHPDNGIDVYFNSKLTLEGMMLAKAWCYGSIGRNYDTTSFFGFLDTNINNIHDIEGADVCSEHAVRVIREADLPIVPEVKEPSQVHPTHIYEYCESKQGKRDGWKKVWSWDGINAFTY